MRFDIGNKITVTDPTADFMAWCDANLVLDNPEYHKKIAMGLRVWNTPQSIYLYERMGDTYVLPFGCIAQLRVKYPECGFWTHISTKNGFQYDSGISLYPYQQKAVKEALEGKNGVLVMPCGSGKTQCGLELISRLGLKALWLTHTQDLLNQSLERAKSVLNCDAKSYGTITGGKVNIGTGITFATVQTMSKLDLAQYKDEWGVVVVDECHKAIGSPTKVMQFYKVLSNLSCRYKFGLTATPKRADGLERAMFALIGDKITEVSKADVADTTCPVVVETVNTGYMPDMDVILAGDGTINYARLVENLTGNEQRFEVVCKVIDMLKKNGAMLVLANRVEYLQRLNKTYDGKSICLSGMSKTKAGKAQRKNALLALNSGEIDCVFATYQLAKEGLDVPNLKTLILATPEKDPTTVEQSVGRVARKAEGKEYGTVVDFTDDFGMFRGWARKRQNIYKKLGAEV